MNVQAGTLVGVPSCDHARYESDIEELSLEILERYEEVNVLYRLSDSFRDMFDEEAILARLLNEAAHSVHASSGCVSVLQAGGGFVHSAGFGGREPAANFGVVEPLVRRALEEGRGLSLESQKYDDGFSGPTMIVPLPGKVSPIGALVLWRLADTGPFRSGEQRLVATVAAHGASVVENRRLVLAMNEAMRVKGEIEIARSIQAGLLPSADPDVKGLQVAGVCRPAEDIGGDYFGYTRVSPGRFGITIADVSGHSIGAAIGMVMARCLIQSEAHRVASPARILTRVNELLCRDLGDPAMFVTVFLAVYQEDTGTLTYTNAGHNPALIHRGATHRIERLSGGGPGLGIVTDARYEERSQILNLGDTIVFYTDGITEARSPEGEMFGLERLEEVVARNEHTTARGTVAEIVERIAAWHGGPLFKDDLTVVVARRV